MTVDKLIAELRAEIERIDEVIAVLEPLLRFAEKRQPRRAATRKRRKRQQKPTPLRMLA
jgi:hypothetical protein